MTGDEYTDYRPGDLVCYLRGGAETCEVGVVKRVGERGCFVAYSCGDTCSMTPFGLLVPVRNGYALPALCERMRQLGVPHMSGLCEGAEDWGSSW